MGFLSEIFGSSKKAAAPTVEGAEAALARLTAERSSAHAEVKTLTERRRALLLVDESDAEIAQLDQTIAAAELRLERLEEIEPKLLADLGQARDRRRQDQWAEMRGRGLAAAEKYLSSARAAHADLMAYAAIIDEATAAQFTAEARASFPFAPLTLGPDLLAAFDRKLERSTVIEAKAPAPSKPPKKPTPAATAKKPTVEKVKVEKAKTALLALPAPRREPPKADAEGMLWVMTTRPGLADPVTAEPLPMAATVRLRFDDAMNLLRSGAVTQVAPPAEAETPQIMRAAE